MTTPIIGPIDADEAKAVYFLFGGEVDAGVNISTASVTAIVLSGTDEAPGAILSGPVTIDNTKKIVSQKVAAPGRAGNKYKLRCQATDAQGYVHVVAAELAVVSL